MGTPKGFIPITILIVILVVCTVLALIVFWYQNQKNEKGALVNTASQLENSHTSNEIQQTEATDDTCRKFTAETCPVSCTACPPCPQCSSIGCRSITFCKDNGFGQDWYQRIRNINSNHQANTNQIVGGDSDAYGCIGSAGYSWCVSKQKCLRTWEESCTSATNDEISVN